MKRSCLFLFVGLGLSLLLSSCHPEQEAYRALVELSERIEADGEQYKIFEWEDIAFSYNDIVQTLNRYEYSADEQQKIDGYKRYCETEIQRALQQHR